MAQVVRLWSGVRFSSTLSTKAKFSLSPKKSLSALKGRKTSIQPTTPVRTRFAPSPTGLLHLGSLRTALYNYLLAKSTGGQFLLRLEDTDQKRLVPGAEEDIYSSLEWLGLKMDEGPPVGGPYGPYKQSVRSDIYQRYVEQLISSGHAYKCYCSKDRLDALRESASKLHPPSLASYDRKCAHNHRPEDTDRITMDYKDQHYVVRFKSPDTYPAFIDLLHGSLNLQVQTNPTDIRYEDPVLMKSDGLPTYHFANVIDDHLMKITHVIRGEEWLPSTPKHIALYNAFGWKAPEFVHIPLLTSITDKKLSKRKGDTGVSAMKERGILPEALINFSALFGWSPRRDGSANANNTTGDVSKSEVYSLEELCKIFTLDGLTKGNAKVDDKKLHYFNKLYFSKRLDDPVHFEKILNKCYELAKRALFPSIPKGQEYRSDLNYTRKVLQLAQTCGLEDVHEFTSKYGFLYVRPILQNELDGPTQVIYVNCIKRCLNVLLNTSSNENVKEIIDIAVKSLTEDDIAKKKDIFGSLRYALAGGVSGVKIPVLIEFLGKNEVVQRLQTVVDKI
ncbi:glutamyl-tRNA synthetase [Nadsonia fulvescens var. elongata DSM 6958]|uniref:Glutamate--tRNA ligase, mitochondrial n=1 Tax=Nadsonia fulvescens var. elongata DSM 6958 TaxID=857566 RepID=A0A1E3PHB8_9ASCO|nr:glutamyl-tRNA synthetase [Nadsonia fulvescens var. elongata DSM 6958]